MKHKSATSAFSLWFLNLRAAGLQTVVCPDSMSFVTDVSTEPAGREDWLELVRAKKVISCLHIPHEHNPIWGKGKCMVIMKIMCHNQVDNSKKGIFCFVRLKRDAETLGVY